MEFWKSLFIEHRTQALIVAGIIVGVIVFGSIVFSASQDQFMATLPEPGTAERNTTTTSNDGKSQLDRDKERLVQQNSSQQQSSSQPINDAPAEPSPRPFSGPFTIGSITLQGTSWTCSGGGVVMYVSSARVTASSLRGGSFTWQLEVAGGNAPSSSPSTATIPQNQISQELTAGNPGYLYSASNVRDGQSVRIRVTSPNDVASSWFSIPDGSEASCKNS